MKYKNINDPYLIKLNKIADQTNYYSVDPTYRIIPQGNNDLKSSDLYYQRLNYEIEFDNTNILNGVIFENFKDYLYIHQKYGKLNLNNDVMNLDENLIKNLNSNPSLYLSSPAADAFNEMSDRHKALINLNAISEKSIFYDIRPKKAFISPNEEHSKYIINYLSKFYNFINVNDINKKIINFKTFIKYFILFYNDNKDKIINKTEFIKSELCPVHCNGLIIEIGNNKHGDDKKAYSDYLRDSFFSKFDTLTKQHGFVMDKHSPWRLTFDIASANAKQYLQNYNIQDVNGYFDQFYYFTEYFNFETLKVFLLNLYNYIRNEKTTVRNVETIFKNGKTCIYYKENFRYFININELYDHITESEFLELYFYIKCKENNIISNENQFNQMFGEISIINKYSGNIAVFDFINNKCKEMKDTGDKKYTRKFF